MPTFDTGSATVDSNFALDNSMGAMMIGVVVSAVLHGLCLLQAFFYYQNYKKDKWYFKVLVGTVVSFDAIHLAFITHAVYHYVISQYHSHQDQLLRLIWTVLMEAVFTGVNAGIVQTFYVVRVFRLSRRNYWLTGTIMMLILATTGCGFAWVIISMRLTTYKELIGINPLTITINALSTTVDISIARHLKSFFAADQVPRSDSIINKLMVFVVNTGVLTTLCAIASLIALIVSPQTLIYATFYFCIGRFYTNSFIATLNARRSISSKIDEGSSHMMLSMPSSVNHQQTGTGTKMQNISIRIDTLKEAQTDSNNMQKGASMGDVSNSDVDALSTKGGHAFGESNTNDKKS
ncbi:hypothetical protein D9619_012419 [Psilocybe cf. subviscida]|uniref:DUF6534 domain-containing protein n=1 Tax=Psilocybe cf. subviscida TaxID=2480587 RepID=A0A8H5ARQ5_9AGAR|nr:hypothetical protein D9619_012419 [Psilocybe cf. subviscida]